MPGRKGLTVAAWMVGILVAIIAAVLLIAFSTGIFGKAQNTTSTMSETAESAWKNACNQAKFWINVNPDKACEILCNNNVCQSGECRCGTDFCIKCDCTSKKFKGYCS